MKCTKPEYFDTFTTEMKKKIPVRRKKKVWKVTTLSSKSQSGKKPAARGAVLYGWFKLQSPN
jgi:hypothetical protein